MIKILKYDIYPYKSKKCRVMKIPKHVLRCPEVYQQYDILSFCEHLILRLSSILSRFQHSACVFKKNKTEPFFNNFLDRLALVNCAFWLLKPPMSDPLLGSGALNFFNKSQPDQLSIHSVRLSQEI